MLSLFSIANGAMRQGHYTLARELYLYLLPQAPELQEMIEFNLMIMLMKDGLSEKTSTLEVARLVNHAAKVNHDLNQVKNLQLITTVDIFPEMMKVEEGVSYPENDDPHYIVHKDLSRYQAGLYGLSFVLFSNDSIKEQNAKLYVDYGEGFQEPNAIYIRLKQGLNEQVVFFKDKPIGIRFDPIEKQSVFCLANFELTTINESKVTDYFDKILLSKKQPIVNRDDDILTQYHSYLSVVQNIGDTLTYQQWIEKNETRSQPNSDDIALMSGKLTEFTTKQDNDILYSIILPVTTQTRLEFLSECLTSIVSQSIGLDTLEVLMVSDNSLSNKLAETVQVIENNDLLHKTVKVSFEDFGNSINKASNIALSRLSGQYTLLLNVEDKLHKDTFYYLTETLINKSGVQFIYSDEDKIDEFFERCQPYFKGGWNPDLFFSQNYVKNLSVYASDLLRKVGFREGYENTPDLLLRSLKYIDAGKIAHIPRVLYHQRYQQNNESDDSKYFEQSIKALQEYFDSENFDNEARQVTVEKGLVDGSSYKINYPIPETAPKVSILMPTRDGRDITEQAVRSILDKTTYQNYDILIIDNGSEKQETFDFFEQIQAEDQRVKVIRYDYPFNYSAINNFGAKHTDGEILALVNNDVEIISANWLTEMVMHALRPEVGCVGAKLYYGNGQIQHAGIVLGIAGGVANHVSKFENRESNGYADKLKLVQNYSAVTAACLLVRREIYEAVGGLDETMFKVAYNDVDFCLKVQDQGYRNLWTPYAELYHYESITRGADTNNEKLERLLTESEYMKHKWGKLLQQDQYYNPNFFKNSLNYDYDDEYTKTLCFEGKVLYKWQSDILKTKDNVCVFVNYDVNSRVHDYVAYYLEQVAKYFDIVFVSTSEKLHKDEASIQKLQNFCQQIIVRKNEGYDFGSWRYGLEVLGDSLAKYDKLLLCNDSVYGPLTDLKKILDEFHESDLDMMGLIKSKEIQDHLQSYFVMYKPKLFLSDEFKEFWNSIQIHSRKWDIIINYEVGFSQKLLRACKDKFNIGVYCDVEDLPAVNVTQVYWKEMILDRKFPFIKVELLRDNPFDVDISDWKQVVSQISDYDVEMVDTHLSK